MKKIFIFFMLFSIPTLINAQSAPPQPDALPKPAWYTSEEIFNNIFSSVTLTINVNVSSSAVVTISFPASTIFNTTGSTVTVTKINDPVNVTGSSVCIISMPVVTVTLSSVTVTSMPLTDVTGSSVCISNTPNVTFTNTAIDVTGSSVCISNTPNVTFTNTAIDVSESTVTVRDERYYQKVSSGTSGSLTGITSAVIVVSENVNSWSFIHRNITNTELAATINPNLYGTDITLYDGDADSEIIDIAAPVTFSITMPVSSTMTYVINTRK